jgi:YVTN family beta-propeller protein
MLKTTHARAARQQFFISLIARAAGCACLGVALFAAAFAQAPVAPISATPPKPAVQSVPAPASVNRAASQRIVEQGIAIEFSIDSAKANLPRIRAGEDSLVRFKVSDTTTGTPVKGLNLSVWMSLRQGDKAPDMKQCRERIQSFIGGTLRERPDVDLNSYYILALNKSADISVIDPLLGFGGSKLLALVMLKSPGEDWVLSGDREKLFVTMPLINQVAVVNTRSWTVMNYLDTGMRPTRVSLQGDEKYLWVSYEGDKQTPGGVTVIDAASLKVAAQIATGPGEHETIISSDNRFAFVSNKESGSISIIDVRTLAKTRDVKVDGNPVSLARSELSKAIYVASDAGMITVLDEQTQQIQARLQAKPGLSSLRFAPGGRYGFAVNTKESTVSIFDAASNRMLHEVSAGKSPNQVIFSDVFAFIRSLGTENVVMIRLATIGTDVELTEFPGGQLPPDKASTPIRAESIVLAPERNAVIVANPGDKVIYYYTEGMAAPMGDFQNYSREPRAVLVVDRSLRENEAGVYSTTVKLPAAGKYDIAFLADAPRVAHCFEATADTNPFLKTERLVALRLEHQLKDMKLPVGQEFPLRFKLIDTATNQAKSDLNDVMVLTYSAGWQRRDVATSLGGGMYEVKLNVPEPGAYMVFVQSPSMRVGYKDLPQLTLIASEQKTVKVSRVAGSVSQP